MADSMATKYRLVLDEMYAAQAKYSRVTVLAHPKNINSQIRAILEGSSIPEEDKYALFKRSQLMKSNINRIDEGPRETRPPSPPPPPPPAAAVPAAEDFFKGLPIPKSKMRELLATPVQSPETDSFSTPTNWREK